MKALCNEVINKEKFISDSLNVLLVGIGSHSHSILLVSVLIESLESVILGGLYDFAQFEFPMCMDYLLDFFRIDGDRCFKQWHQQ